MQFTMEVARGDDGRLTTDVAETRALFTSGTRVRVTRATLRARHVLADRLDHGALAGHAGTST